jgi:IrrE N-terminal-like domain
MKLENEVSMSDVLLECLGKIWAPCGEAARLQAQLGARSLAETAAAAERAGCTVCYVDLPEKVSGFADIIDGQTYIVLNRAKSRTNLEYTLPHELGHQVLHLKPSRDTGPSELPVTGREELEANLFAVTWISWQGTDGRQDEVLRENKEASATVLACFFVTVLLAVVALLAHIGSKLFPVQHRALPEPK